MRSSKITADVRAFFTSYCTAFIRQDAPAIARHFADLVHVASDAGDDVNVHVATAAEWRKTIDRILEMYRAIDVASVEATGLATDPLSSRLVQARLRWALSDRAARPQRRPIGEASHASIRIPGLTARSGAVQA